MPGRYIRDGYLTSERVDALSLDAERFYFRLLLVVDDFGRYLANAAILRSMCFPLKGDISTADVTAWLSECIKAGLVKSYAVDGKKYLAIDRFGQNPRSRKSRYPSPENAENCFATEKQCSATEKQCFAEEKQVSLKKTCFSEEKHPQTMFCNGKTMFSLNDNDNDNGNNSAVVVASRAHAHEGQTPKTDNNNNDQVFKRQQSQIIPYPMTTEEVLKEAEKICYAMTGEEAENFIAYYAATGWRLRGEPIRDWRKMLTIWKTKQRKDQTNAKNGRPDYKRVATDEEFRRTTHFDDPAEFLAPAARGIVEGQLHQNADSSQH